MSSAGEGFRVVLYRVLALSLGLGVALFVAEVVLRAFDLAPVDGVATVTAADFDRVPGIFKPGQRVQDRRKPDLAHWVTIDSLGYRGDDFPRRKPDGEYRIVLAGDSGTWGDFVDNEETLPARLQESLESRCAGVRVINAGLGGSSILSQAHMIRRSLDIYPDLVLLKFNENDIDDLLQEPIWDRIASNRTAKSTFPFSLVYPVVRRTALWNLGLTVRARMRNRQVGMARAKARREARKTGPQGSSEKNRADGLPAAGSRKGSRSDQSEAARRQTYRTTLESIRDDLNAEGIGFVLVVSPSHQTVAGKRDTELLDWVTEAAGELSIPTIDLLAPLVASGREIEELYLLPRDGHASPLGYRIAAEALASELAEEHLPADRCPSSTAS